MSDIKLSKATQLLASYSCWDYAFNKKVRHKFKNISKSFLSNSDSIDYTFVLKVAQKTKILHNIYLIVMFLVVWLIFKEFINIYNYYDYMELISIDETLYENFDTDIKTADESLSTIFILIVFAWFTSFIYDVLRYKRVFDFTDNINEVDITTFRVPSINQNICIFSGQKPFVGSGTISKKFSFIIPIDKARKLSTTELTAMDFSEDEIYNTIQNTLSITNNTIQKLYINGSLLNGDENLLSVIDTGEFGLEIWQKYSENNDNAIRRYICVTNISQSEEIQSSFFIRFVKSQNSLFIELTATLLPPIAIKYRVAEQLPQKISFTRLIVIIQNSIITAIMNLAKSVFYVLNFLFTLPERVFEKNRLNKQIQEKPLFDYGESSTLREDVADISLQTFYNAMDDERLFKQMEKTFFDSLISFLESKNIDTSDLSQQQTTIINNGLMMSGGEVKADNIAVGKMSQIFRGKKS